MYNSNTKKQLKFTPENSLLCYYGYYYLCNLQIALIQKSIFYCKKHHGNCFLYIKQCAYISYIFKILQCNLS